MHDPTTVNSQGPDVGTQYRSAIFTFDDEDKSLALKIRDQFKRNGILIIRLPPPLKRYITGMTLKTIIKTI